MILTSGWAGMQSLGVVAAEVLWKATLVLMVTAGIAWVFQRASAATRHLIWTAGVAATLALPIAIIVVPAWRVSVLPAPAVTAPDLSGVEFDGLETQSLSAPASASESSSAPVQSIAPATFPTERVTSPKFTLPSLGSGLFGAWLFGVAALIAWVISGLIAVRRLAHRARPVHDPEWLRITEDVRGALGVRRPIMLLESDRAVTPMTFGIFTSAVLLPSDASNWDGARKRVVLLHELAHIARCDVLVQLMAQVTCALYWFHPLVWYAARQLRGERERACDDSVVIAGERPSEYAMHLLDVARSYSATALLQPAALAMARSNQLEGRLIAVLKPGLKRARLSRTRIAGSAATAFAVVLPLSAVTPAPRAAILSEPGPVSAAQQANVVRHPRPSDPIEAKWQWAFDEGSRGVYRRGYWVGYSVQRIARASEGLISGSHGFNFDELSDTPLQTQLFGTRPVRYASDARVPRDVAILFQFPPAANDVADARVVRLHSMHLGLDLGRLPVLWLGDIDDEQSIRWLKQQYAARNPEWVKDELIEAVGMHQSADLAVPFLQEILENESAAGLRTQAAEALGQQASPQALALLRELARNDGSIEVRREAAEAIGEVQLPGAVEALLDLARNADDEGVRKQAAEALGEQGSAEAARALDELVFDDVGLDVQRQAAEALGEIPDGRSASAIRRAVTRHPRWEIRAEAAEALAEISPTVALPILQEVIAGEQDQRVLEEAVEALGELGSIALRTLREISREHPDREIRMKAAEALSEASKKEDDQDVDVDTDVKVDNFSYSASASPNTGNWVGSDEEIDPRRNPTGERLPIEFDASQLISHADARNARDADAILALLASVGSEPKHDVDLVSHRSAWALSRVRNGEVVRPLIEALSDDDWRVRAYAGWALAVVKDQRALNALLDAADDEHWRVRAHALGALGELDSGSRGLDALIGGLDDEMWQVRASAAQYIGDVRDGERAARELERVVADSHIAVRGAARESLRKMNERR